MSEHLDLIEPGDARPSSPAAMRAGVAMRMASAEPGLLTRFWRKSRAPLQAKREPCYIVAVLIVLDRGLALDGLVTGINDGAVMFRQASTFIFDRTGAEVSIRFGDYDRRGRISSVSSDGYLVDLNEVLSEDELADLLYDYGQMPG